jgi:lysophospholipase L1-like esterase
VAMTEDAQSVVRETAPGIGYKPLLKSFFLRLCIAVTVAVVLMTAVELFSYKRYLHYGSNDVLEAGAKIDLEGEGNAGEREYWKEFEQSNKVLYHQYVLWRRAPYSGALISINNEGVRRTLHTRCDDKTFTLWTFGDSVMWGGGAPDDSTIASYLALDYEKAGKPVCIVNYAEKGWSNTQEMIGLIELLKHATKKPDLVLFYDGGTEAFAAYQSGGADVHSNFGMFKDFLETWGERQRASFSYLENTNTYKLLHRIAAQAPFHHAKPEDRGPQIDVAGLSQAVIQNYVQNIDIINLLARQYSFRAIFAWYPNLAVGHKQLTPFEQQVLRLQYEQFPNLGSMYQAVYNRSVEINRPNFYNLADVVDDQTASLYLGISHMKPEGDQIVAHRLFELLNGKESTTAAATRGTTSIH